MHVREYRVYTHMRLTALHVRTLCMTYTRTSDDISLELYYIQLKARITAVIVPHNSVSYIKR